MEFIMLHLMVFKIYDSTAVDSNNDDDEVDYLSSALAVKLIGSSLYNKLYKNITGLDDGTKFKTLTYAKLIIFTLIGPFRKLYSSRLFFEKKQ